MQWEKVCRLDSVAHAWGGGEGGGPSNANLCQYGWEKRLRDGYRTKKIEKKRRIK